MNCENMVASIIEGELRRLPPRAHPKVILLDPEHWERLLWEIQTCHRFVNSEVRAGLQCALEEAETLSRVREFCYPDRNLIFRRNAYISGVRINYGTGK